MMAFHGVPCLRRKVPGLMLRSPPVSRPYSRNVFGQPTSPPLASESVACPKLAPRGIMTRVGVPCGWPTHAALTTHIATSAMRFLTLSIEGLLEQNRRRERIDIALSAAG